MTTDDPHGPPRRAAFAAAVLAAAALAGCGGDDGPAASSEPSATAASEPSSEPSAEPVRPVGPTDHLTAPDARGDVFVDDRSSRRVDAVNADLTSAEFERTGEGLTITLTYTDLVRHGSTEWGVWFQLTQPGTGTALTTSWSEFQYADTGRWARQGGMTANTPADADSHPCPGLRGTPDFAASTLTIVIPDRCLGDADWVQVEGFHTVSRLPKGSLDATDTPFSDTDSSPYEPKLSRPTG